MEQKKAVRSLKVYRQGGYGPNITFALLILHTSYNFPLQTVHIAFLAFP